jgi:hypothetical protein
MVINQFNKAYFSTSNNNEEEVLKADNWSYDRDFNLKDIFGVDSDQEDELVGG